MSSDGNDFVGGNYSVTLFEEANSSACILIELISDQILEGVEFFTVELRTPHEQKIQLGKISETNITIIDAGKNLGVVFTCIFTRELRGCCLHYLLYS